jgi:UPF0716 protein FxsA
MGAMLLRFQGWTTLQRTRMAMAQGEVPALEMLEGVLLVFAGIFLLIPGFFTDALGFLLLVPPLRRALIRRFLRGSGLPPSGPPGDGGPTPRRGPYTIEGEYHRDDE